MRSFLLMKAGKICLIIVTTISIVYLGPIANPVWASDLTVVTIVGDVSGQGGTLQVGAQASGTASSLDGLGFDSPVPGHPKGYCRIPLAGSLSGNVITLTGNVAFSNDPSNIGTPVTFRANAANGSITFIFGAFTFTGTGSVVIAPP